MGCGSCSTGSCGTKPNGCKGNGGCSTGGCNKLNTYDWFQGMQQPTEVEHNNIYEIRFKNTRKAFFMNVNALSLVTGDAVIVESDRGYDLGLISLGGVLARLQMKKRRVNPESDKIRKIYRIANQDELKKLRFARSREQETMVHTRIIVRQLDLDMKISDVEFQADNTKAIFYYIADSRVDFRELIKRLANEFRIRVEMKQIGLRHESGLVGGIGSCGRELCCSTWLTDFKSVSTAAARFQNLSLNPMKISGQCGRLKCCLNFELETYMDALRDIPKVEKIETEKGISFLQKTDIFKRIMWFSYAGETTWIPLEVEKVITMKEMNAEGKKPASLQFLDKEIAAPVDFVDVVGQATLREDPRRRKKKKRKPGGRGGNRNQQARKSSGSNRQGNKEAGEGKSNRNRGRNSGNSQHNSGNKQGGNSTRKNTSNSSSSQSRGKSSGNSNGGNRRGGKPNNNQNK